MDRREAEARVGQTIDRYRIEAVLGCGGFGAVFRARHLVMDRLVALKLLHVGMGQRAEIRERFLREARTLGRLGHPNVVAVHDSGLTSDGEAFLVMELLEGEDLASRVERFGRLGVSDTLAIVDAILDGLSAAHAAGVVHRDLKPANVFLARGANGEIVKLVDFGISKVEDDRMTRTGMVLGTPVYMAPECFLVGAAGVDARADLYAVGVILYELLSGLLPYDAPSYEALVLKVATEPPAPFASVAPGAPPELARLVDRAMARRPEDRFTDARSMRAAIAELRGRVAGPAWAAPSDAFAATAHLPATPIAHAYPTPAAHAPYAPAHATPYAPAHAAPYAPAHATPYAPAHATPAPPARTRSSSRALVIAGVIAGVLGLVGIGVAVLAVSGGDAARSSGSARPPLPTESPIADAPTKPVAEATDEPEAEPEPRVPPKQTDPSAGVALVAPSAPTKPSAAPAVPVRRTGATVTMHEPNVVGEAPIEAIHDRFEGSLRSLDRCRRAVDETVYVQLHVHDGRITLAGPDPNRESSDDEVARCVANVMREGGPLPSGQGIVQLAFDLAAR